jgi:hypothetical protein
MSRKALTIRYRGFLFIPKSGASKFTVGPDAWLKDEGDLEVFWKGEDEILVKAPNDPQILFPPAEIWVRANRYEHLLKDDVVDGN